MGQQWRQWQYEYLARRNHTSDLRLEPVENDGGRGIATFVSLGSWCFCGIVVVREGCIRVFGLLHLVGLCNLGGCTVCLSGCDFRPPLKKKSGFRGSRRRAHSRLFMVASLRTRRHRHQLGCGKGQIKVTCRPSRRRLQILWATCSRRT